MAKNSGPNPRSFPKNNYLLPPGGRILPPNQVFTPIFRLHTVTTGSGDRPFGCFLRPFHLLIEIYPMVPFPPSVRLGVSDVRADVLRWGPVTSARAGSLYAVAFTVIKADLEAFSPGRAAAHDGHGRLAEGERAF